MSKRNSFIVVAVFILCIGFSAAHQKNTSTSAVVENSSTNLPSKIGQIKIAGVTLNVDLALTEGEQAHGLSGRKNLKEDQAMLFVFDRPAIYPFWMKDMNFPIDMIWIDEDLRVVYIKENAKPDSYPAVFTPNRNSKYVLEVGSGFSKKNNLKVGDSVELF